MDPETKDIMILKIGNIEPNEKVMIEISYIEELTLSMNTFYRFALPVKNSPRFFNSIPVDDFRNSFQNKVKV